MKNLSPRLLAVADMIEPGQVVVDVGTDHGSLPVYLVGEGIVPAALACDLRPGPLASAAKNVMDAGLTDKIHLRLSDGLDAVSPHEADCAVMAGMGGLLIVQLIDKAKWLQNTAKTLVLQPQSDAAKLRRYLYQNGFEIFAEKAVADRGHIYTVMKVGYTGQGPAITRQSVLLGGLLNNMGQQEQDYIKTQINGLTKRLAGLRAGSVDQREIRDVKQNLMTLYAALENKVPISLQDVYQEVNDLAPFDTQMDFDNAGLLVGAPHQNITKIGVALDVTVEVVEKAVAKKVNCIVCHHPVIFHPLKAIDLTSVVGRLVQNGIGVIAAHTNLDAATGGVNDALAGCLELKNVTPLALPGSDGLPPMGRLGRLPEDMSAQSFAAYVGEKLHTHGKFAAGGTPIKTVALCGGAGDDILHSAKQAGADALVTGEVKHHNWLLAKELGLTVVEAGHFETEVPVVKALAEYLQNHLPVEVVVLEETAPAEHF